MWELRLSNRDAARSVSAGTVDDVLSRASKAGLSDWEALHRLSEDELEAMLYRRAQVPMPAEPRPEPDCAWIHRERGRPGVTLELLHQEYLEQHPGGLRYSAFCERYREFIRRRGLSMRQHHVAGDKMFVDYSSKKPHLVDPTTGEVMEVELFVAMLGASNYTYAEATYTQQVPDFVGSHRTGLPKSCACAASARAKRAELMRALAAPPPADDPEVNAALAAPPPADDPEVNAALLHLGLASPGNLKERLLARLVRAAHRL